MTDTATPVTGATPKTAGEFIAALLQVMLNVKKVQCLVAHQFDGPQLHVFRCSLGLGEDPKRVERLSGALVQAAGAAEARVSRGQGCVWIEIPKAESERQVLQPSRLARLKPVTSLHVLLAGRGDQRRPLLVQPGRSPSRPPGRRRHHRIGQDRGPSLAAGLSAPPEHG